MKSPKISFKEAYIILLFIIFTMSTLNSAHANIKICNEMPTDAYASINVETSDFEEILNGGAWQYRTYGWLNIPKNSCTVAFPVSHHRRVLSVNFYFVTEDTNGNIRTFSPKSKSQEEDKFFPFSGDAICVNPRKNPFRTELSGVREITDRQVAEAEAYRKVEENEGFLTALLLDYTTPLNPFKPHGCTGEQRNADGWVEVESRIYNGHDLLLRYGSPTQIDVFNLEEPPAVSGVDPNTTAAWALLLGGLFALGQIGEAMDEEEQRQCMRACEENKSRCVKLCTE